MLSALTRHKHPDKLQKPGSRSKPKLHCAGIYFRRARLWLKMDAALLDVIVMHQGLTDAIFRLNPLAEVNAVHSLSDQK